MRSLLSGLTLEEKASLCLGSDFWHTAPVPRLGIPAIMVSDGPHGLRRQPDEGDHVGISGSLPATCFPTASALGSSLDPDLARRVGAALGEEARAQGVQVVLGPGINIKRSPLCGRNFEYFSEDPLVSGVLGAALVEGVQSQGVGASVKHYAANNQETDRLRVSADVDERTLREIYLPGFERVVTEARPWTVMCAYNKVNGTYASQHRWLLTDVLRDEWGFDGLVVSDWGAVHDRVAALAAGLDLEMPPNLGVSDAAIVAAVRAGELDEAVLDQAVARVLALVDRAPPATGGRRRSFDADAHHALARAAAAECAVLLKNEDALLPLRAGRRRDDRGDRRVRPHAALPGRRQLAGQPDPGRRRARRAARRRSGRRRGGLRRRVRDRHHRATRSWPTRRWRWPRAPSTVVAFLGLPAADESEGFDRAHMDLPADQTALLAAARRGQPAARRRARQRLGGPAVGLGPPRAARSSSAGCPGQAAGGAAADLLLGAANPSGRLAETLPLRLEDNPSYLNFPGEAGHVRYGEGVFVGYRGYDALGREVSYPFGHGLSYTRFDYADLDAARARAGRGRRPRRRGDAAGSPTPAGAAARRSCSSTSATPRRPSPGRRASSRGSPRSTSSPGETETRRASRSARATCPTGRPPRGWVLEAGRVRRSPSAPPRATCGSPPPSTSPRRRCRSRSTRWRRSRSGSPTPPAPSCSARRSAPTTTAARAASSAATSCSSVIGNFPIGTLAAFPGLGLDHDTVDKLLAAPRRQLTCVPGRDGVFNDLVI